MGEPAATPPATATTCVWYRPADAAVKRDHRLSTATETQASTEPATSTPSTLSEQTAPTTVPTTGPLPTADGVPGDFDGSDRGAGIDP